MASELRSPEASHQRLSCSQAVQRSIQQATFHAAHQGSGILLPAADHLRQEGTCASSPPISLVRTGQGALSGCRGDQGHDPWLGSCWPPQLHSVEEEQESPQGGKEVLEDEGSHEARLGWAGLGSETEPGCRAQHGGATRCLWIIPSPENLRWNFGSA